MRRILRQVAAGQYSDLGDVTTLADPEIVDRLIEAHRALRRAAGAGNEGGGA
jgi:acetyl-CoA synthetase